MNNLSTSRISLRYASLVLSLMLLVGITPQTHSYVAMGLQLNVPLTQENLKKIGIITAAGLACYGVYYYFFAQLSHTKELEKAGKMSDDITHTCAKISNNYTHLLSSIDLTHKNQSAEVINDIYMYIKNDTINFLSYKLSIDKSLHILNKQLTDLISYKNHIIKRKTKLVNENIHTTSINLVERDQLIENYSQAYSYLSNTEDVLHNTIKTLEKLKTIIIGFDEYRQELLEDMSNRLSAMEKRIEDVHMQQMFNNHHVMYIR